MVGLDIHLLTAVFSSSEVHIATSRVSESWPWYIVRAAGFVAAGLLILLMLSGIGQVSGITYKYIEPIKAWALHKALALSLCLAVSIHIIFLYVDHYLPFSLTQIFIPFVSHYSNKTSLFGVALGSFAVALGVFALYGIVILVLTSLGWIDTKKSLWRKLHYISYFVIFAVMIHALGVGSDLRYGVFRKLWILIIILLIVAVLSRLRHTGSLKKKKV
jgi:hypothetical protein